MKNERKIIKIMACFLAAFLAVGAGFAFCTYTLKREYMKQQRAEERLRIAEAEETLKELIRAFDTFSASEKNKKQIFLTEIHIKSLMAERAFSDIECTGKAGEEVSSFLLAVSSETENAIMEQTDPEVFERSYEFGALFSYCKSLEAFLYLLENDANAFFVASAEVFSDTVLENIIYENGYGEPALQTVPVKNESLVIKEWEAKKLARKFVGKNAFLDVYFSKNDGVYYLYGSNTSAIVNAMNGSVMQFLFDSPQGEREIERDEAEKIALNFLREECFYVEGLVITGEKQEGGLYVFEFSPIYDEVICLSERITLGVSETTGRVKLFDAVDYYRYHRKRLNLPKISYGIAEINEDFRGAEDIKLCKIERAEGVECFCYTFRLSGQKLAVSVLDGSLIEIR